MKTIEVGEATNPLADYIAGVQSEPLVITDHGTPIAVILPLADVDLETIALGTDLRFQALIERSRARAKAEGTVPPAEDARRVLENP